MPNNIDNKINNQLTELKTQLSENISAAHARGSNISSLQERTANLKFQSVTYQKQAERVKNKKFWELWKWVIIPVSLVGLYIIV